MKDYGMCAANRTCALGWLGDTIIANLMSLDGDLLFSWSKGDVVGDHEGGSR